MQELGIWPLLCSLLSQGAHEQPPLPVHMRAITSVRPWQSPVSAAKPQPCPGSALLLSSSQTCVHHLRSRADQLGSFAGCAKQPTATLLACKLVSLVGELCTEPCGLLEALCACITTSVSRAMVSSPLLFCLCRMLPNPDAVGVGGCAAGSLLASHRDQGSEHKLLPPTLSCMRMPRDRSATLQAEAEHTALAAAEAALQLASAQKAAWDGSAAAALVAACTAVHSLNPALSQPSTPQSARSLSAGSHAQQAIGRQPEPGSELQCVCLQTLAIACQQHGFWQLAEHQAGGAERAAGWTCLSLP